MMFPILITIAAIGFISVLIKDIKNSNAYFTRLSKTHREFVELWEFAINYNLDKMEGVTYNNKENRMKFHNGRIDFPIRPNSNKRIAIDSYHPLMKLKRSYNKIRLKGDWTLDERKSMMLEHTEKLKKNFEEDLKPYIREKRLNKILKK
ncbi:MAG: hypothetical protein SLAVMIC_00556 [uncultured marine phage]|uniref:Uncharacterized protein n=1 Tax=uncultured marine phage TaxID=707152 RepID=A0A8D9FS89_9VIRU|nr:MAG: hypothetical protein SLAVMIC_00556 [uncultured marine phage]